jgi:hypothetical protein
VRQALEEKLLISNFLPQRGRGKRDRALEENGKIKQFWIPTKGSGIFGFS